MNSATKQASRAHEVSKLRAVCVALLGTVVAFAACTDLFHSTDDFLTQCQLDAAACSLLEVDAGTNVEAGDPVDFCSWTSATAQQRAAHACAWLGACQTPLGNNAFGACVFQAMLAYDCASNPSHRATGETRRLWACLASVRTCDDVSRCVLPSGTVQCSDLNYVACLETLGSASASTVRIECSDAGYHGENCALWGEACNTTATGGACGAAETAGCGDGGAPSSCNGSMLMCDNGQTAFDCSGNGSQACTAAHAPAELACIPNDAGSGPSCAPDAMATCSDGVASSCPTGVPESIQCGTLLGVGNVNAACAPGPLAGGFDWTSPCTLKPPECTADACGDAGADASSATLVGCVRGAAASLDCKSEGLGPCRLVPTHAGTEVRPACTPP